MLIQNVIHGIVYTFSGVSVGFRTPVYTVEESITMIEVCLDLSVPTAIVIDVTLSVVQDTALCEFKWL